MEISLAKSMVSLSYENQPAADVFLDLGFHEGIALVLDPRVEIPERLVTFKVKDLSLKNSLSLALSQFSLKSEIFGGAVLITKPEWLPIRNPSGRPLWATPDESQRAEAVIDDLASEDPARQEKARTAAREAERSGITWIWHGRGGVDKSLISRFSDAMSAQAAQMGVPLAEPTGGAYQESLTPAQLTLLSKPLSIKSRDKTLETILKSKGIALRLQAPMSMPLLVSSTDIRLDTLLVALTQPLGLDFYMDGDTIVIDKAENVRKAVEKK